MDGFTRPPTATLPPTSFQGPRVEGPTMYAIALGLCVYSWIQFSWEP